MFYKLKCKNKCIFFFLELNVIQLLSIHTELEIEGHQKKTEVDKILFYNEINYSED